MEFLTLVTTIVGLTILVFAVTGVLIGFGYWMGRNSAERPFRSQANPGPMPKDRPPIDDPAGDLFNEAAYGYGDEDAKAIPTIGVRQ